MSTATATLGIAINTFRPIGGVYSINATMTLLQADPPEAFSFDGTTLIIKLPAGTPVELNYQLPDPDYALLGVAFNPVDGGVGRKEFPSIAIERDLVGSEMTVLDASLAEDENVDYFYVILVQQVSTGDIGVIDPDIESELP